MNRDTKRVSKSAKGRVEEMRKRRRERERDRGWQRERYIRRERETGAGGLEERVEYYTPLSHREW